MKLWLSYLFLSQSCKMIYIFNVQGGLNLKMVSYIVVPKIEKGKHLLFTFFKKMHIISCMKK